MRASIGIDYHGVITAEPKLFSIITTIFTFLNYDIHIITGTKITEEFKEQLDSYGIRYTHLFSISDYHHSLGTEMIGYEEGQPKIDDDIWNREKARYCYDNNIILHIDDSEVYGKYFSTPYVLYNKDGKVALMMPRSVYT